MLATSGKLRRSVAALAVLVAGALTTASVANAVELKVLSPQVMKLVLDDLIRQFERSTGNRVTISYATASALIKEIDAGIVADLAILSPNQIEQLQDKDKIVEDSLAPIAKLEFGVIVRKGAAKPDVSTVHSLKQALLSAKTIASGDPETSTSGEFFASLIERLQIDDEIKPKIKTYSSGTAALRAIAKGEADIGIGVVAAIEPETEIAGALPAQAKKFNSYAVGILTSSNQLEAAKALASYLSSPTSLAVMKSKGFEAP